MTSITYHVAQFDFYKVKFYTGILFHNFYVMNYMLDLAWSERCKQILKKWRALPNDKKAPYLTQARDNRAAIRMKKTQQVNQNIIFRCKKDMHIKCKIS